MFLPKIKRPLDCLFSKTGTLILPLNKYWSTDPSQTHTFPWGSPWINAYFRPNHLKVSVFENRHLIFYKTNFVLENVFFTTMNKNFVFMKKKHFPFLWKKSFFMEIVFLKLFKNFLTNCFVGAKVLEILKNNSSKKFVFQQKRKMSFFFIKTNFLVYWDKNIFFPKQNIFIKN